MGIKYEILENNKKNIKIKAKYVKKLTKIFFENH